jgi:Ca2+-binding EF-hand superfamily protein
LRKLRESNAAVVPAPPGAVAGKIVRYAEHLVRKYDKDGDGQLKDAEINALPESLRVSDFDRNGVITADEFARRILAYGRRRSLRIATLSSPNLLALPAAGGDPAVSAPASDAGARPTPGNETSIEQQRRQKRFFVPLERLPSGVPRWFLDGDADGDGQVTLAELSAGGSSEATSQFSVYDANGDGVITAAESLIVRQAAGQENSRLTPEPETRDQTAPSQAAQP